MSPAERIAALLDHLGLDRVHVGACMSGDWGGLLDVCAERVATLLVVAPHLNKGIPEAAARFAHPVVVVAGDDGAPAERARGLAEAFPNGHFVGLSRYASPIWADTVAERLHDVEAACLAVVSAAEGARGATVAPCALAADDGTFEGIRYRIRGHGPPLLLLPLSLARSQWQPLVEALEERFCTVTLGGAHLGAVALLEGRAAAEYGALVADVVDAARLGAGEVALEVGCGSGALSRALLARAPDTSRVVATDVNPYLLEEAAALAAEAGLGERIRFEESNAERLRFGNDEFEVAFCCTVLEEGHAERMLGELVRVTRPGGRVAVVTRAIDVDWWVNAGLADGLRRRVNANGPRTGAGVGAEGCADSGLYRRALRAGLRPRLMGPRYAAYRRGERLDDVLLRLEATLPADDLAEFRRATAAARREGTLLVAEPFHCFVGEVNRGRTYATA